MLKNSSRTRHPEGAQTEKTDQGIGQVSAHEAEEIFDVVSGRRVIEGRVLGVIGDQADEDKNQKEEKEYADNFLSHN
jgi:hypothetical protein